MRQSPYTFVVLSQEDVQLLRELVPLLRAVPEFKDSVDHLRKVVNYLQTELGQR